MPLHSRNLGYRIWSRMLPETLSYKWLQDYVHIHMSFLNYGINTSLQIFAPPAIYEIPEPIY